MKIELEAYDHTCADGCCTTYGYDVFVDGVKIGSISEDAFELADLLNEYFDTKREMTQNQILDEIQDLQDLFLKVGATERYYAMTMLKDRILTFNTKDK